MISSIRPDKAEFLLIPEKELERTADDRTLNNSWIKIFIVCGILTVCAGVLLALSIIRRSYMMRSGIIMLVFAIVFDIYVVSKYVGVRCIAPSEFKKAIAKYGRENILAQLRDSNAFGFFIDEDNYNNLTILTLDYLIGSNEFIYALKEIKAITVSKSDQIEERIQKYQDEHIRNCLRCAYAIEITLPSGLSKRKIIAMTTPDLNAFFGYLQQRAPHIKLTYK